MSNLVEHWRKLAKEQGDTRWAKYAFEQCAAELEGDPLYAAAPDLLAALKAVGLAFLHQLDPKLKAQMDAAIDKATGEGGDE